MDDKESILKKVEDGIKGAAKAVEDFADEIAAPQALGGAATKNSSPSTMQLRPKMQRWPKRRLADLMDDLRIRKQTSRAKTLALPRRIELLFSP